MIYIVSFYILERLIYRIDIIMMDIKIRSD